MFAVYAASRSSNHTREQDSTVNEQLRAYIVRMHDEPFCAQDEIRKTAQNERLFNAVSGSVTNA